jgi:hypothetical protein
MAGGKRGIRGILRSYMAAQMNINGPSIKKERVNGELPVGYRVRESSSWNDSIHVHSDAKLSPTIKKLVPVMNRNL